VAVRLRWWGIKHNGFGKENKCGESTKHRSPVAMDKASQEAEESRENSREKREKHVDGNSMKEGSTNTYLL
jgi:hypothetical protein